MTDVTIAIIVSAVAPTTTAAAALIVGLRNSRKAAEIHTLVNSNLSTAKAEALADRARVEALTALLVSANARVDILTSMIASKIGAPFTIPQVAGKDGG